MKNTTTQNTPLLTKFVLNGLNGYKNIAINCKSNVKIIAGDNGSGKTSLLNALYAILAGKPSFLYALNFESFELHWSNQVVITSTKKDLFGNIDQEAIQSAQGFDFFTDNGLSPEEALELITLYILNDESEIINSPGYKQLYRETPFDHDDILRQCERVASNTKSTGGFLKLHQRVKELIGEVSILYLPTYRRIEASLPEFRNRTSIFQRRSKNQKDDWNSDRLINFGLEDVEEKLSSISTTIRRDTLAAYSRISGKTLEELINLGESEDLPEIPKEVDIPSIQLVLSRIGRQSTETESKLAELIRNGEIGEAKYLQLRRFLAQLRAIYAARRDDEQALERFATLVNDYFSITGTSEKEISFDKQKVELQVINKYTQKPLKLGALSSGEKQIVSVFARLLLDSNKRYFIIIDEPELSLSMEWQERLLPDITKMESCFQLVAVTHSPFIFKNELSSVSGSLEVEIIAQQKQINV